MKLKDNYTEKEIRIAKEMKKQKEQIDKTLAKESGLCEEKRKELDEELVDFEIVCIISEEVERREQK